MQGEKKKRGDFADPRALISKFHLEMDRTARGMAVMISGVISVPELSAEAISLKTKAGIIHLEGKRLSLSIFENGTVEIVGRIEFMRFGYGKN